MSDEQAPKTDEMESMDLVDDELDEVAGGKILNRANPESADNGEFGTQWAPPPELPTDAADSGGGVPGTYGSDII